jgi:GNAT superfamily N-acetyltransferase
MPLVVRPATAADAAIIVEFNRRLALESEGKALDPALLQSGVQRALTDASTGRYFVAVEGDQILGQLGVTYEWSDWRNGWFWWIQSVYVQLEARRRGVFRTLFQHIEAAAKNDPHVIGIRLYLDADNDAAQRTYEALGLKLTGYKLMERYPL